MLSIYIVRWLDLYLMIMPSDNVNGKHGFGLPEISGFLALAGLFIYMVFNALTKASLTPKNHPFYEESLHHEI